MMARRIAAAAALAGLALLAVAPAAPAQPASDPAQSEAAIRARLDDWAAAIAAGDHNRACRLFAADLVSVVQGAPDAGRREVCTRIALALARPDVRMRYTPRIEEVLVMGDHAVVRVTWRLEETDGRRVTVSEERGMDLFRRDPDGVWRVIRFIAFTQGAR